MFLLAMALSLACSNWDFIGAEMSVRRCPCRTMSWHGTDPNHSHSLYPLPLSMLMTPNVVPFAPGWG